VEYQEILYEVEHHIATITLNCPERLNAFSPVMLGELADAAQQAQDDPAVRAIILTGAGRAFCSGGNVKTMAQAAAKDAQPGRQRLATVHQAQLTLRRLAKPLIVAVNGPAYGGGLDLACAGDFRIASDQARFAEVYVRLGLAPGGGGTWFLPRIVGLTKALELILSGETIDAQEALRIGLVSQVVPHAELLPATRAFAERFTSAAPLGVQAAKRGVYRGLEMPLDAALEFMSMHLERLRQTEDHKEGLAALAEKRQPRFVGR
jgi:2-(1,2-epoxy-1,2-dihydrophenyl)acetyl-CoA isomerase